MNLLGWMNFKLKQKGNEPANNVLVAQKEVKSNGAEMVFQEEQSDELFFPGFLAIGTLGYQTTNTDPPTPTFPMPFEFGEADITGKELKVINEELEKFLEEKVNEAAYECGDERIEAVATECYRNVEEFPLQKYLFGSSVELPEPETEVKQQKEFLDKKKSIVQEGHVGKDGKEKKQGKKKHAMYFMKKMLQNLQSKSNSSASSKGSVTGSVSSKKKLPQVLKMFKRKVHPLNENKLQDNLGVNSEVNKTFSLAATPKKELNASKISPRGTTGYDALVVNREHWIKTDDDYLVLEL